MTSAMQLAVDVGSWQITSQTLIIGALTGLTYAVLAAGLVLVYRATRVINFAHGQVGAFGAAVLAKLVLDEGWNYWVALLAVLVTGSLVGAAVELGIVRRLFKAPRLVLLVATIGVSELLLVLQAALPGVHHGGGFPSPLPWHVRVGGLLLGSADFMVLLLVPAVIVALGLFLSRTRLGLAIRASAANADRAELVGISTRRVSTLVWVLAGALSTLTAVLVDPVQGIVVGLPSPSLGPSLLLRALAAAMVGGMASVPLALVGGIGVGVLEAVLLVNTGPGVADAVLFAAILVMVLARVRSGVDEQWGSWRLGPNITPVPERLRQLWWVKNLGSLTAGTGLVVAVVLPLVFATAADEFRFSETAIFALIALSVTVLTGWAGQLSLGQFAFVGLGAMMAAKFAGEGMAFPVAAVYATVGGMVVAVLIGFPALRVKGMYLAIVTLAFAVASAQWLFQQHIFTGGNTVMFLPRQKIFGFLDLRSERTYYYLCLAVLVGAADGVARLRRSGAARRIIAVRENERAAAGFTLSAGRSKLTAFALAGGLGALAGALLAGAQVQFQTTAFSADQSLQVVAITVIGGLGSVAGAILGAVYIVALPALLGGSATASLLTSSIGLLVLLLYLPGGLMQLVYRARDSLLALAARRLPPVPLTDSSDVMARALPPRHDRQPAQRLAACPALEVDALSVRFGGRLALDGVSLVVEPGEVVGLIGSNGAGKSTLMNVVSGFVTPASGTVAVLGTDVADLAPHERAGLGMGRVFQDAALFGALTVRETVKVALETHEPSELIPALLGLPPAMQAERAKQREAGAYIDFLGLGRYSDSFLSDLSTGTRRIVELCCLLAQGSRLLLMDEPTAGVAQKETEAFGPLIRRIQAELGATILVIEHDMPLVMSMSDRIYCFAAGRHIADGPPETVRNDPRVIAAYLGTDERAIQRSGTKAAVAP